MAGARELNGLEGVDEAGEDEEDGDPGVALGYEAEDGPLEKEHLALGGAAAWEDEAAGEAED